MIGDKRNTAKEKAKENKKHPYKNIGLREKLLNSNNEKGGTNKNE